MRTETIEVFTFDELSNDAQKKAIDWYRYGNEMEFMPEAMREELEDALDTSNFYECDDVKVYYSLAYCQGDGAQFVGRFRYRDYYVKVESNDRYCHKYAVSIDIYDEEHNDAPDDVYEAFKAEYHAICDRLESYGYSYIDHENDDDNIAETLIDNEYEFTSDGKRY